MTRTRRVVLDLMKPHDPRMLELTERVADLDGVDAVNAVLLETDRKVENVKLTIEGEEVPYDAIADAIEALGGTVHSVDQVVCGDRLVEETGTPQDRVHRP